MDNQSRPVTGYPAATGYPHTNPNPNGYSSSTAGAGAAAYPYAAAPPPQAPYYNPNPYYGQPYSSSRVTFLRRLFAILVASIIVTGTITFIVWLVLRPRLPQFQVDSISVSNFNVSVSSPSLVTGNWDVRFTVRNPNHKMKLYYDQIGAYVFYKSESLAETTVPPFDQDTKNQTSVRATFAALSTYIEGNVANDINLDHTRGTLDFNVRMLVRIRFKAGAWRARRRYLRVYCGSLTVGMKLGASAGTLVGGSKECRVDL